MTSGAANRPVHMVSRERVTLTLGLPFMMLLAASLVAWPWIAWGLPVAGTVAPPSVVFLAAAVAGSLYAIRRKLPLVMITWVPAGQGAIAILGTGFLPPSADPLVGLAVIIAAYAIVFLLLLGLAVAVASHGLHLAVSMVAFFVMTQATRFPIFEAEPEPLRAASFLTLAAALRATLEIGVLVWLASRLVTAPEGQAKVWAWAIVGLTLAHGAVVSWEDAARQGEFTVSGIGGRMLWWFILASIPLGMVTVLARLRRSWMDTPAVVDVDAEDISEEPEPPQSQAQVESGDDTAARAPSEPVPRPPSGRPTPRKRRRR